jgi:C4-dicarboxylate-specific signal transduction histidine kinase
VATDITLQKQTQELNRQQQEKLQLTARLISVGEMASTLAHELNQPLAAIANYNMGCVRRLRSGEYTAQDLLDAMEKSNAQAERAGKIIQRVREMVRRRDPQRAECSINDIITDIAHMIEIEAEKNGVALSLRLAPSLPRVMGDRGMLEQAILNLTRNAIEAMRDTPAAARSLMIASRCDDRAMIEIDVCDSGCGIPDELADNLFTPFFTTKRDGMGMGLTICRSIAEFHDGRLWASRNADAGSTFHFSLAAVA